MNATLNARIAKGLSASGAGNRMAIWGIGVRDQ
jgi:hypothetical protein